jgi:hypothetical protein
MSLNSEVDQTSVQPEAATDHSMPVSINPNCPVVDSRNHRAARRSINSLAWVGNAFTRSSDCCSDREYQHLEGGSGELAGP